MARTPGHNKLSTDALARARYVGMVSALLYGAVAVSMVFINKHTMSVFPLTNIVMTLQMAATWAILQPLQEAGYLTFPRFSLARARQLFGITLLYTANTGLALVGLKTLNVPMYNVLKRLTPMLVLVAKALLRRHWPSRPVLGAVVMVVAGCIIAGIGDLTFDLAGYAYALASCAAQGGYLLLVEFQGAGGISSSELLYYNAVCSLPVLALVVVVTGELAALPAAWAAAAAEHGALTAAATVAACSLAGVGLNYALFLCTTSNSALTTTIVGVLKGVVATLLGFVLLGGVPFSPVNVAGIVLNTVGGTYYTWIKFNARSNREDEVGGGTPGPGSTGGTGLASLGHSGSTDVLPGAMLLGADKLLPAAVAVGGGHTFGHGGYHEAEKGGHGSYSGHGQDEEQPHAVGHTGAGNGLLSMSTVRGRR